MRLIDKTHLGAVALQGRVAVVTGAGQGIGREAARVLAHLGAAVVIAEINAGTGQETEGLIRASGGQALFVQTDVADCVSVAELLQRVQRTFGAAHILVNNAEAFAAKSLLEHSIEEWDRIFAVNVRGAFLLIRAFLPDMLKQRAGIIVTMESADGMPWLSAYLASKVGLRSLALSLAAEVGDTSGVHVFCFGPGMVATPGGQQAFQQLAPRYGLTTAGFIEQSAPGGKLISAELCATGLAGTILNAALFHGQEAYYVQGLSQLGLDADGELANTGATTRPTEDPPTLAEPAGSPDVRRTALALNQLLEALLQENQREYDALSMFQGPVIKRMFQQGTGQKLEAWQVSALRLTHQLASGQPLEPAGLNDYLRQLRRLAAFMAKQEGDARGWIRDPQQLQAALAALQDRQALVQRLVAALELEAAAGSKA